MNQTLTEVRGLCGVADDHDGGGHAELLHRILLSRLRSFADHRGSSHWTRGGLWTWRSCTSSCQLSSRDALPTPACWCWMAPGLGLAGHRRGLRREGAHGPYIKVGTCLYQVTSDYAIYRGSYFPRVDSITRRPLEVMRPDRGDRFLVTWQAYSFGAIEIGAEGTSIQSPNAEFEPGVDSKSVIVNGSRESAEMRSCYHVVCTWVPKEASVIAGARWPMAIENDLCE